MVDKKKLKLRIVKGVVFLSLGAAFVFARSTLMELTQFNALNQEAEGLLDDSLDKNLTTFVSLSGIKAVVALLEGSSVGVGFDLEVGDLVQPAYDYLDFVWKIFLYALMALSFYKLLMETGLLGTGFTLVGVGLLLAGIASVRPEFRRWARFIVIFGILLAYIIPAALISTDYLSRTYLVNVKEINAERIESVRGQLGEARDDIFDMKEKISVLNPVQSIDAIRSEASNIANTVSQSVWDSMFAFLTFVLILMVELLLLPFLTAFILYKTVTLLTRSAQTQLTTKQENEEEAA